MRFLVYRKYLELTRAIDRRRELALRIAASLAEFQL
jgi:hypothetical protein